MDNHKHSMRWSRYRGKSITADRFRAMSDYDAASGANIDTRALCQKPSVCTCPG